MKEVDFIIVGQGLAGTTLAHRLIAKGKNLVIIDENLPSSASKISSGIINPITGRRYVKSWLFDELLPEAVSFYSDQSKLMNQTFIEPHTVLRGLTNVLEENVWMGQSLKSDYAQYFGDLKSSDEYTSSFKNELVFGEVRKSHKLDVPGYITASKDFFKKRITYVEDRAELDEFEFTDGVTWRQFRAKAVIFAEGWKVIQNPFFNHLPFDPAKGEVFITKLNEYHLKEIIKNKRFILPWDKGTYWVGSTNEVRVDNDLPSERYQKDLEQYLSDYVNSPYEILEKLTAVRPNTKQRRPILGKHPEFQNVYLFNGLGTKGASLAPYFSKMLTELILTNKPVLIDVNILKFHNS